MMLSADMIIIVKDKDEWFCSTGEQVVAHPPCIGH